MTNIAPTIKEWPTASDSLSTVFYRMDDSQLKEAYHAATLLFRHSQNLGLHPFGIRLGVLAYHIASELDKRGKATPAERQSQATSGTLQRGNTPVCPF
jgi:hypothetical protein